MTDIVLQNTPGLFGALFYFISLFLFHFPFISYSLLQNVLGLTVHTVDDSSSSSIPGRCRLISGVDKRLSPAIIRLNININ